MNYVFCAHYLEFRLVQAAIINLALIRCSQFNIPTHTPYLQQVFISISSHGNGQHLVHVYACARISKPWQSTVGALPPSGLIKLLTVHMLIAYVCLSGAQDNNIMHYVGSIKNLSNSTFRWANSLFFATVFSYSIFGFDGLSKFENMYIDSEFETI